MVICLERGADLHMAQLMPLPLTVSCFSKIQIGFAFLVPAHPGSTGQRAVKRMCVKRVCVKRTSIKAPTQLFAHNRQISKWQKHNPFRDEEESNCLRQ